MMKIRTITVDRDPIGNVSDVSFTFVGCGHEQFSCLEFAEGSKMRERLETIVMAIEDEDEV